MGRGSAWQPISVLAASEASVKHSFFHHSICAFFFFFFCSSCIPCFYPAIHSSKDTLLKHYHKGYWSFAITDYIFESAISHSSLP